MLDTYTTAIRGAAAAGTRISESADRIANLATNRADLAKELVNIQIAKIELRANAAVIRVQNENDKRLLDIKV